MKILAIICITCVVITPHINAETDAEYQALAKRLLNKIKAHMETVEDVRHLYFNVTLRLNNIRESSDLRISTNQKMIDIENKLERYRNHRNIQRCKDIKISKTNALKEELVDLLEEKVQAKLHRYTEGFERAIATMGVIRNRLRNHLREEIFRCEQTPRECKIKGEFKVKLDSYDALFREISYYLGSLVNDTAKSEIFPLLSQKIRDKIAGAVNDCIATLK